MLDIPKLQSALAVWQKIAEAASGSGISGFEMSRTLKEIKETVELDPEGLTAAFLLQNFVHAHVRSVQISAFDILTDPAGVQERLRDLRYLLAYVDDPDVVGERSHFIEHLREATNQYAPDNEKIEKLYGSPDSIARLRRDALRSAAKLHVDQFSTGAGDSGPIKYDPVIRQWWNVNSLLGFVKAMPNGISLHVVRHPHGDFLSYFCFGIRVGARVFVVSDKAQTDHPLQNRMRRRPDRDFENRAARNWFPYELLDVGLDEESNRMFEKQTNALIPHQAKTVPLREISDLNASELVWLTMMFDLLAKKFWSDGFQVPQLSYTAGECPSAPEMSFDARQITKAEVLDLDASSLGEMEQHDAMWMLEKYGPMIPESALNLIADARHKFAISMDSMAVGAAQAPDPHAFPTQVAKFVDIAHMDGTEFGTADKIDADRKFIARYNLATAVHALAKKEFDEQRQSVLSWYRERVNANMHNIVNWCTADTLITDVPARHNSRWLKIYGASRQSDDKRSVSYVFLEVTNATKVSTVHNAVSVHTCAVTGVKPSYAVLVQPVLPEHLAALAGCAVTELPVFLQHWCRSEQYHGNHILDRIDPMAWACQDPWLQLNMRVGFSLSKRGLAAIRRDPVPLPDWLRPGPL